MFNGMMMAAQSSINRIVTISSDQVDWNLINEVFAGVPPTVTANIVITINAGVNITSSSTSIAPMDLTGLPDGSTILINNNGNVYGAGGDGGEGTDVFMETTA